jgi:hypothetical protein
VRSEGARIFDCPDPNDPQKKARTNDCLSDEVCLDVGLCAKRSYEQRACAKTCGGNDDCRGGYECRLAGTAGSMLLSADPNAMAHFCAPKP